MFVVATSKQGAKTVLICKVFFKKEEFLNQDFWQKQKKSLETTELFRVEISKQCVKNFVLCKVFSQERGIFKSGILAKAKKKPRDYRTFSRYEGIKVSKRWKLPTLLDYPVRNF
ncbi:hypothetical protein M0802_015183 [Mischocyttarus mexicanus]|nr:hypothetical protein M0802_015183 [Mischocyttarus mexicanus]